MGGNELPHAMLVEHRAATPAPANVATQQAEIIQPIFGQTGAAHLAIPQPSVEAGAAVYPIISARPTPETPAEGVTVTADIPAGSFTADLLKPQAAPGADRVLAGGRGFVPEHERCTRQSDR